MNKTKIIELSEFGQSIWLDYISRPLIEKGKLSELIDLGLKGMTSNPTIFDKAVSGSNDYDKKIQELRLQDKSTFEIYDDLTAKDIQDAADLFKPVFKATQGLDGYVSLEVNPKLAFNVKETVEEAKRLHKKVNRPNVMFKVPSTKEGFQAVGELTASGINVNVTLIFSVEQYIKTTQAYFNGIKQLLQNNGDASKVHSVASVFVSRVDTVCDKLLDEMIAKAKDSQAKEKLVLLKGKAAVANSGLIYEKYVETFSSDEFEKLKNKKVNIQRALWGSTSTKNPSYSDIKYVAELIGKGTINTIPQKTFDAFLDHGKVEEALTGDAGKARGIIDELNNLGIDINGVCEKLLQDGVIAFEKSFESLLRSIKQKAAQFI
jgi:transaldolase